MIKLWPPAIRDARRTPAMLDLVLAVAHHLLVFTLFGVVFSEIIAVRQGMSPAAVRQVAAIDIWYGVLAALILLVGFSRAYYTGKGWDYYNNNGFFWAKIGTFAVIGLLSVYPTTCFIRWRRAGLPPDDAQVAAVRRLIYAELALFALLPTFAAAMARGYGQLEF
jgi:putative membrane protein